MQKKVKIKILLGIIFLVSLAGVVFYFYNFKGSGKVELNLTRGSEEQKISEEAVDMKQKEDLPPVEILESEQEDNNADDQLSNIQNNSPAIEDNSMKIEKTEKQKTNKLSITNRLVTWGFQKMKTRKIDTLIIHSSYDAFGDDPYSVSGVIAEYKTYSVSPHYLIDRKGKVSRLVADQNVAYHAGKSKMPDGRTGVNNFSLGIELLTTKKEKPTQAQYDALKLLIASLKAKYKITAILGHNQIAPDRKDDPWNFEWKKLK